MNGSQPRSRRIRILRDEVSRKIAAGEVIDRPHSIVRELLENAIDSGAASIDVFLEAGGLSRVRVVDDGAGMSLEDLEVCWKPHATSKIESEDDLMRVSTLGFRGRRFRASPCAAGFPSPARRHRMSPRTGWRCLAAPCKGWSHVKGERGRLSTLGSCFSTTLRGKSSFEAPPRNLPCAGLSLPTAQCLTHPWLSGCSLTEKQSSRFRPPRWSDGSRLCYAHQLDARMLAASAAQGNGFAVEVIAGRPELRRRDRKLIQVFVNRRRVSEYSLMQAVEYGFCGLHAGRMVPGRLCFH